MSLKFQYVAEEKLAIPEQCKVNTELKKKLNAINERWRERRNQRQVARDHYLATFTSELHG